MKLPCNILVIKDVRFFDLTTLYVRNLLYLCNINKQQRSKDMARPIKETPVLKGKDAENFAKRMANPAPVSKAEKEEARKAYEAFKAISTFPM